LSATEVELADQMCLSSNAIVIATGASPRHPKFFDFSKDSICDVQELVRNQDPPRSITIVGADWTGCEWAFVCASTGAEVTLVDRRSRMLRAVDSEVRGVLQSSLIEMGVDVVLCEKIADWSLGSHGECQIKLGSGRIQVSERLLVLEGQCGNIAGLGLGELGVQTDDHDHIAVDDDYQSSVKGIFAIGAVSDPQGLGHAASLQAEIAVASVVGDSSRDFPYDPAWTLYSATEIALCGLTQEACETLGLETVAATAVSEESTGRSSRLAKVVVNASTGRMVGVQLAGPGAPEAIGLAADLVGREAHIRECVRVSGPDGTLAGLCAQAFRLALAELKAGRFGTEWSDVSQ